MATALDVITAALKKLRILRAGAQPKAADAEDCLTALNEMLAAWSINGIDLALLTLELSDEIDVPDDHVEAIKLNLAVRIADDFGAQPTAVLIQQASGAKEALIAHHWSMNDLTDDNPLARNNLAHPLNGSLNS